jgi:hypothetical protein
VTFETKPKNAQWRATRASPSERSLALQYKGGALLHLNTITSHTATHQCFTLRSPLRLSIPRASARLRLPPRLPTTAPLFSFQVVPQILVEMANYGRTPSDEDTYPSKRPRLDEDASIDTAPAPRSALQDVTGARSNLQLQLDQTTGQSDKDKTGGTTLSSITAPNATVANANQTSS